MSIFRLQQFSIEQSLSGMKVCSDSLLFGAMIPMDGVKRVLDIGSGTGLLALMQAQKAHSLTAFKLEKITAVELTHTGAQEARKNFSASPWSETLELIEQDIQGFAEENYSKQVSYDLIISNPPFFIDHSTTQQSDGLRKVARHTDTLSFDDLCRSIRQLITNEGSIYLLLPLVSIDAFSSISKGHNLSLLAMTEISESEQHQAKVALLWLKPAEGGVEPILKKDLIHKFGPDGNHTPIVKDYLKNYLLRYSDGL